MNKPTALALVGKRVIHVCTQPVAYRRSHWEYKTERREVVLMAVSGRYAMVQRPRFMPYVCTVKELEVRSE